jgi:ABC-2 type transport system ATP-binding protein
LDLAASLVIKPQILFLDEPTTGLDPRGRLELWNIIRDLVQGGTTVLLTTQYMEEADQLAHWIFVIDQGRIIAQGTAGELKRQVGGDVIELHLSSHHHAEQAAGAIRQFGTEEPHADSDRGIVTMPTGGGAAVLVDVVRQLDNAGLELANIVLRRPSLDDVFLKLTGHSAE